MRSYVRTRFPPPCPENTVRRTRLPFMWALIHSETWRSWSPRLNAITSPTRSYDTRRATFMLRLHVRFGTAGVADHLNSECMGASSLAVSDIKTCEVSKNISEWGPLVAWNRTQCTGAAVQIKHPPFTLPRPSVHGSHNPTLFSSAPLRLIALAVYALYCTRLFLRRTCRLSAGPANLLRSQSRVAFTIIVGMR